MNEEEIWRQYLPTGFTARPTTLADAEAATDLFDASAMKYTGQRLFSLEQTLTFWQSPGFNLAKNSRVVWAPDGRMAAQIDIDDTTAVPVCPRVWGRVHPDFEGLGVGTALLVWAEQCAQALFVRIPADARIALMVVGIPEKAMSTHQLLTNCGFRHVRDFWRMVIELEQEPQVPIWPSGITLSNMAERPDIQAVAAVREEAFRDHWGHVEQSLAEATENLQHWLENDSMHEPAGELLAMAGDEIAGICLCSQGEYLVCTSSAVTWILKKSCAQGQ